MILLTVMVITTCSDLAGGKGKATRRMAFPCVIFLRSFPVNPLSPSSVAFPPTAEEEVEALYWACSDWSTDSS